MPRRLRLAAAVLLLGLAAAPAQPLDPQRSISQYVLGEWGARDLGGNAVHALLQTPDRYLWLGTTAGLLRFDGARFILYNARTHPGFGDGGVTSLSLGPDGAILYGSTSGAVVRFHEGKLQTLHANAGPGFISDVHAAADGRVWWGQAGRPLVHFHEGRNTSFIEYSGIGPLVITGDGKDGVWFGSRRGGVFRFDGQTFHRAAAVDDVISALHVDRAGRLWIGTPHGLLRLEGTALTRYTRGDGLPHESISALLEDRDGNLWIGTAGGGLGRWTGGRFTGFTAAQGLADDDVTSLLEDHEGNVWVGTADGLNCLSDGRFITFGRLEGLEDPAVTSVAPGVAGDTWVGTMSGRVVRLHAGGVTHYRLPGGGGSDAVIALRAMRDGDVWAGLDNGRLYRLRDGAVREETPFDLPENRKVSAIGEDDEGPLFFVHGGGLARLRGRRAVSLHPDAPTAGYVHQVVRDRAGATWLASSIGLVEAPPNGPYRIHRVQPSLPQVVRVRSLSEDPAGGFWLATSAGLARFRDGRFDVATVAHGLPENYLRLVLDDGRGALWIASMGHLFRVAKEDVEEIFAGRRASVAPVLFATADGLRATEASLSSDPGFRDAAGRLWFATAKGAAVFDPARSPAEVPAPRVLVERFTIDEAAGDPRAAGPTSFKPGRGEVTIEYTTLTYRAASHVRFRHRLVGLDHEWVAAGPRRSAYYSNLQPGSYRFVVQASNPDGLWNGPETEISFAIRPPFRQTVWFYAACLAAFLAVVAAAYKFRLAQMQARFAAIVDERTRIARELHDTLAQMLAAVGFQIDTALKRLPDDPAQGPLRRNMELAHSMVRSGLAEVRRSIWVLRAQASGTVDDLASSLSTSLSQLTGDSGIGSTFTVTGTPRPLPPEVQRNLLRIAHEAVSNAVRHAQATSIGITLHFDAQAVCLRVHDDGRGFEREKVKGEHFGLVGIGERARAVGGEARVDSRPGAGTEIACRVPYEMS